MQFVIGKIVDKIVGKLADFSSEQIGRQANYWFDCEKYIRELGHEAKMIEDMRSSIQAKVEIARNNGDVIVDGVDRWLKEVGLKLEALTHILEEQLSDLSVGSRRQLGQIAERETEEVNQLKARGKRFDSGPVSYPAPVTCPLDTDPTKYERFGSRDGVYASIMEALRDEGDGSYKIGIGGLPGVGKTRMAFEVAKQALDAQLFDEVAKATVSQNPDFHKIRQDLADCLNLRWNREDSLGRAGQLRSRLRNGKRILLVLDDVWDEINLMEIGIPNNIKGCKVLITSREGGLWDQMGIRKAFGIEDLLDDEAWELFRKKVGDSIDQPEIHGVAKQVCGECGRSPLVILVVGGALIGKEKHVWDDTLRLLINFKGDDIKGMKAKVYKSIELSYKYLNPDPSDEWDLSQTQSCFLHCCLFAEDAEISVDDLVRYGLGTRFLHDVFTVQDARNRVHSLVDKLKVASLLLQGKRKNTVKMHDVIRDVGISIASKLKQTAFLVKTGVYQWQEKDKYDCCGTITLRSNAMGELPDELKCPNLRTLVLAHEEIRDDPPFLKIPSNFLKRMEKLEVLDLTRFDISMPPSSLQNLVNLRMLSLTRCRLVSLSLFSELHKLEILCLNDCSIEKPPTSSNSNSIDCDVVEPAIEAGKLNCLQILDFRHTEGLRVLPKGFISNLSRLEELYIYEFDGWEAKGNTRPLELNSLACLSILEIHLPNVMLLPKDIHFESLIRFKISIGSRIDAWHHESISRAWYNGSISRALKIENIPLRGELKTLIERAQALIFIKVNDLEKVLHDKDFPYLEYLEVEECNEMEHLLGKAKHDSETSLASLGKLRMLKVSNCKVKYLFSRTTAKRLQQLQQLCVENCESMEGIIGEKDDEEAPKLRNMCANMKQASSTECNTSTSTTQPLFNAKLEELSMKNCENMKMMVAVEAEAQGEEANDNVMVIFPQLKNITLEDLPDLKSFCSNCALKNQETMEEALFTFKHNVKAPHLEVLHVKRVHNLKEIWHSTVSTDSISMLTKLRVRDCGKLLNIGPVKLLRSVAHNLEKLEIIKCPLLQDDFIIEASNAAGEDERVEKDEGVRANVESSVAFRRLKMLSLSSFDSLLLFSEGEVSFPMLERLKVSHGSTFEDIWEGLAPFLGKVRELTLKEFSQLVNFSAVLQRFEAVEKLTLDSCSSLQVVFNLQELDATEGLATLLGQVKYLILTELPKLQHIWMMEPKRVVVFSNLLDLNVGYCNNLRYLLSFSTARALTQLKFLHILNCDAMEDIVMIKNEEGGEANLADEIVFPQLVTLLLEDLPKLRCFCRANNAFQFLSLKNVWILGCPKLSTFTCGPTGLRENEIRVRCGFVGLPPYVSDINEYVRQYAQKLSSIMQDEDGDGDDDDEDEEGDDDEDEDGDGNGDGDGDGDDDDEDEEGDDNDDDDDDRGNPSLFPSSPSPRPAKRRKMAGDSS